jgi:hypothetical protein
MTNGNNAIRLAEDNGGMSVRFLADTKGYATQANALKKLREVCGGMPARYFVAATEAGRFVPVVWAADTNGNLAHFAVNNIAVI